VTTERKKVLEPIEQEEEEVVVSTKYHLTEDQFAEMLSLKQKLFRAGIRLAQPDTVEAALYINQEERNLNYNGEVKKGNYNQSPKVALMHNPFYIPIEKKSRKK
jgi:hypothetical protein